MNAAQSHNPSQVLRCLVATHRTSSSPSRYEVGDLSYPLSSPGRHARSVHQYRNLFVFQFKTFRASEQRVLARRYRFLLPKCCGVPSYFAASTDLPIVLLSATLTCHIAHSKMDHLPDVTCQLGQVLLTQDGSSSRYGFFIFQLLD